jgi:hypothetical protein
LLQERKAPRGQATGGALNPQMQATWRILLPASHKIKIDKLRSLPTKTEVSMWSAPVPKVEARALLQMVGHNGTTVEAVRELIAIPPEIEQHFRAYASDHPEDESAIERVIEFRRRVGEEFDRLVPIPIHQGTATVQP